MRNRMENNQNITLWLNMQRAPTKKRTSRKAEVTLTVQATYA